uniref:Uncharacterized protein n=1 Tax=Avena sativa TaxID=4498 RepID=A0ACD5ZKC9_AVESA
MDWYEWLSRAGLGEDLAAEYALLFESNELGAADVRHLDHAFLATVGVAVAKHRLEILKLARKDKESSASLALTVLPWRATRLLAAAAQRSARSVAACLRSAAHRNRRAAVAPRPLALRHQRCGGGFGAAAAGPVRPYKSAPAAADSRGTAMKLAALLARFSKPALTLTRSSRGKGTRNGAVAIAAGCFTGRETCSDYDADDDEEDGEEEDKTTETEDGGEDPETPWESMFQDLNPT